MLSPYEPDPLWSGGRVTLPDGTTFIMAVNCNTGTLRIRNLSWLPLEQQLGPLGQGQTATDYQVEYVLKEANFITENYPQEKASWYERICKLFTLT